MSRTRSEDHRRAEELRARTGLDRFDPEVGGCLIVSSTSARRHARERVKQELADAAPGTRELAQRAADAVVQEFALLADGRLLQNPTAGEHVHAVAGADATTPPGARATDRLLAVVADVIREHQIDRHPVLTAHTVALHKCLRRYVELVRATSPRVGPSQPQTTAAAQNRPHDVAFLLCHALTQHYGDDVGQVCVTVHAPIAPGPRITAASLTISGPETEQAVYAVASDHLAFLHPSSFLPTPQTQPAMSWATVHTGPVAVHDLVRAYQSALLFARMIRLEWATAAGPLRCMPYSPTDFPLNVLERLAPHLQPLLGTPLPHRLELARTLHRLLGAPATLQEHAKALRISASTLRQRQAQLQPILGSRGLPSRDVIALASLLPALISLWEIEQSHGR